LVEDISKDSSSLDVAQDISLIFSWTSPFAPIGLSPLGFWAKGLRPLKDIIIIGGANGAGKSTSAPAIIP
jgi:hypothetical protein